MAGAVPSGSVLSSSGVFNSETRKCGIIGFTYSLAREGAKYNTLVKDAARLLNLNVEQSSKEPYCSARILSAPRTQEDRAEFKYSSRDVILYHLGIGVRITDHALVFEGDPNFHVLPKFGVRHMLLHGEQFLEKYQYPIQTSATLITRTRSLQVIDKGKAALIRRGNRTTDASTVKPVFYNESVAFVRGSRDFGGSNKQPDRGAATAANIQPSRAPDRVIEKISEDLVPIFRLSGDLNPLHIDPSHSAAGGFKAPILHGLETFGISGKHIVQEYGPFRNIMVRFRITVIPGETLVTEMWIVGDNKIVYHVLVKETGKLTI